MTGVPEKSCARVFQSRMLELPTNRTALRGGGWVRSAAAKAAISDSQRMTSFVAAAWPCASGKRNVTRHKTKPCLEKLTIRSTVDMTRLDWSIVRWLTNQKAAMGSKRVQLTFFGAPTFLSAFWG